MVKRGVKLYSNDEIIKLIKDGNGFEDLLNLTNLKPNTLKTKISISLVENYQKSGEMLEVKDLPLKKSKPKKPITFGFQGVIIGKSLLEGYFERYDTFEVEKIDKERITIKKIVK